MEGGEIPVEAAEALPVLIPKETHPSIITKFRLISFCNVIVKVFWCTCNFEVDCQSTC